MTQYDKTNKGAVWKKKTKKGDAYLNGTLNVEGKDYFISLFTNTYKEEGDNKPLMNVSITPIEEKETKEESEIGEDLPF